MTESVTAKVKEAVAPSQAQVSQYVSAGVSAFSGFALSAYIGASVGPAVQNAIGGKVPILSGATVARFGTALAASLAHTFVRSSKVGSMSLLGVSVKDITFYATAGAAANTVGSLIVDLLDRFGGDSTATSSGRGFIAQVTGIGGAEVGSSSDASEEA